MTVEERKKVRKVLNAKGRADILVCPDDLIKGADGAVTPDQCEIMTEEERKEAQKAADKSGLGITVCPDNGVEKIGYGIGLIVVTLGYFFFINL
uniref:Uncharacterized protein n=1 Tax=Panagrolaimus superbus TaxID=310955 RepID=A0A914Y8L9_9BILA